MDKSIRRCKWATNDGLIKYHDTQWGVPVHDDSILFEMLTLEGAQAGLSWDTILKRRSGYRKSFDNFDIDKVSRYTKKDVTRLLQDKGIIRNKLKIESAISNAKCILKIQNEFDTFDRYIWSFVDFTPIINSPKSLSDIPPYNELALCISKDLKKRGFRFVGPTICYAFMQAVGLVNDHTRDCFRYEK